MVPGGFLFLSYFLHQLFSGSDAGYPYVHRIRDASASLNEFFRGFQSTNRANPLAQKILKATIDQKGNGSFTFYAPDKCKQSCTTFSWILISVPDQFLNGTKMPENYNYNSPSVSYFINGRDDPTSQRFEVGLNHF